MSTRLSRIKVHLDRAVNAFEVYRNRCDAQSKQTAEALMRTTLVMMANYDHDQGDIDDHEHEQRLLFIHSADVRALRNELLS